MKNTLFLFATLLLIAFASCSDGSNDMPTPEEKAAITIDSSIITNGLVFDAAGGEKSVSFSVNKAWTLSVAATTGGSSWCTASVTNGGEGDATVKFTAKENTSYDDRSVSVTIKAEDVSKTFTITQKAVGALLVTSSKFDVSQEGGSIDVEVKANITYQVDVSVDWIKQTPSTKGLESKQYHFTVDENTAKAKREGTITFIYKELKQVVKVTQAGVIPYMTFTAEAPQILKMSNTVNTLQYSWNGKDWKSLGTTRVAFGGEYGALRLRGKSSIGTNNARISFENDTPVACSGDIRTLVDYEDYENVDTSNARFYSLFEACTSLTSAPELPATTLAENCYYCMFYGCTSLTSAPELPAATLAKSCYGYMFEGCTRLTSAPELPATTLAEYCYYSMFQGCTSLTSAPELPATTLAENCYSYMFYGCKSLTSAPKLPATTLAEYCYHKMFNGCTSLTTAPELPATTLAENCYSYMFYNCTSLTSAPEQLPATTLAESCYESMFYGCTSLTSVPELPATTLAESCYKYMFGGCKNLTSAPKLPATTLAEGCYSSMFSSCTSLTSVPELPATTLAESCYESMFSSCTSLTSAPKLPATTLAGSCYIGMFNGCTSLTSAPEQLPATTLAEYCYYSMFRGCTSLTTSPKLPATTLAKACYGNMFYGCKNLNMVTMLALSTGSYHNSESGLYEWLYGVSSTGTFIKAAKMNGLPKGASGIPEGWTVKNYGE